MQRTDAVHVDAFLLKELTLRQAYALLHLRVRSDREARRLHHQRIMRSEEYHRRFGLRRDQVQMRTTAGLDSDRSEGQR
eukprot:COSAG04_NODE_3891_length_2445_cov_3.224638_1_plen_79_part_00